MFFRRVEDSNSFLAGRLLWKLGNLLQALIVNYLQNRSNALLRKFGRRDSSERTITKKEWTVRNVCQLRCFSNLDFISIEVLHALRIKLTVKGRTLIATLIEEAPSEAAMLMWKG